MLTGWRTPPPRVILWAGNLARGHVMAIDTSTEHWKGENFDDLVEYLQVYSADGYPAETFFPCVCAACGHRFFKLRVDQDEGCARRICGHCGDEAFIANSEEYWHAAQPKSVKCACRNRTFEVAVAYAVKSTGDIRWVYVGHRCEKCGTLGTAVDWRMNSGLTDEYLK